MRVLQSNFDSLLFFKTWFEYLTDNKSNKKITRKIINPGKYTMLI